MAPRYRHTGALRSEFWSGRDARGRQGARRHCGPSLRRGLVSGLLASPIAPAGPRPPVTTCRRRRRVGSPDLLHQVDPSERLDAATGLDVGTLVLAGRSGLEWQPDGGKGVRRQLESQRLVL